MEKLTSHDIEVIQSSNGIFTFSTGIAGKVSTILTGVHGDEELGPKVVLNFIDHLEEVNGKINFVFGNLKALQYNQRYIDVDMNRLFGNKEVLSGYEVNRVRELIPLLHESDYLLDIHNTFRDNNTPFLISEHDCFHCDTIEHEVSGFDYLHPCSSDQYMNSLGKKGFCLEIGSGKGSIEVGNKSLLQFLKYTGNIKGINQSRELNRKKYHFDYSYKTHTSNFRLRKNFKDFESLNKGELIGYDGNIEVLAPYSGIILFAYEPESSGKISFCLGR